MLHRTHWIANNTGTLLINSKGVNVGSSFTFLKTIKSYADQFNANEIHIAWDRKLSKETNFRNTLMEGEYKAGRDEERNKEVYAQVDGIIKLVNTLGIRNIFPNKLEADDVISWLSQNIKGKKIIISVDRDFIQLISPDISFYNPIKKQLIDIHNVEEHYGLNPREYLYYKAIMGDPSDNIKGIEGYGKVKSMKLAKAYHLHELGQPVSEKELQVIDTNLKLIQDNLRLMDLGYGLIHISDEGEVYNLQHAASTHLKPDFTEFRNLCAEYEFESILNQMNSWQSSFSKRANNDILAGYFKAFE